jgi:hypothetical protein
LGNLLQRKLKLSLVLLWAAVIMTAIYAFLNMPFFGNVLPPYNSERNPVNFVFRFGVGGLNELDTFHGTFTKDLCIDNNRQNDPLGSRVKADPTETHRTRLLQLPQTFPLSENLKTPSSSYYLKVQNDTTMKEVSWNDNSVIDSAIAAKP